MDARTRRGLQAAIVAYTMWGLFTLYWKQLVGLDAIELIGWRVASAVVVMGAVLVATGRFATVVGALTDRAVRRFVVVAAALLTVNWTTYVWAVTHDRVLETALGYFLAPLATMAIGVRLLGERLTPAKRWSIVCAVLAVAVMTISYGRMPWVALALAVTWSSYGLTKRRVPLDAISSLSAELAVLTVPALAVVAIGFGRADGLPHQATNAEWGWLIGTGVITAAPLLLFAVAAQRVPFTLLGPAQYIVPLINFVLGWLVFDEALPPSRVVGFSLVWTALALVTIEVSRGTQAERRERSADKTRDGAARI